LFWRIIIRIGPASRKSDLITVFRKRGGPPGEKYMPDITLTQKGHEDCSWAGRLGKKSWWEMSDISGILWRCLKRLLK
jgi:hypothetical protein